MSDTNLNNLRKNPQLAVKQTAGQTAGIVRKPKKNITPELGEKLTGWRHNFLFQLLLIGLVDVICLGIIIFILGVLPQKSQEVKKLKSLVLKAETQGQSNAGAELISENQQVQQLMALFPDEEGLIKFVKEIDNLKAQGIVTQFSFASDEAVKEKSGYRTLPIIIQFSGTNDQINQGLRKVQSLPFLIRAISVEIDKSPSEDKVVLKFGGVLYVGEKIN